MVYGIVQQAGGNLAVWSEPGKGTSISVWLPADRRGPRRAARARHQAAPARPRAEETILLVEDEDVVRRLVGPGARFPGLQGAGGRFRRSRPWPWPRR